MSLSTRLDSLNFRPEFEVLGMRLRPLTIGHAYALQAMGLDKIQTLAELFAAVSIVQEDQSKLGKLLESRLWSLKRCIKCGWTMFWLRVTAGNAKCSPQILLMLGLNQWRIYLNHYQSCPNWEAVEHENSESFVSSLPTLLIVEHVLTSQCGFSVDQVRAMPVNEAFMRYGIAMEREGAIRIVEDNDVLDQQQQEAEEFVKANAEKWAAYLN